MNSIRDQLTEHLQTSLLLLAKEEGVAPQDIPGIFVSTTKSAEHGDFACNAAMNLAKKLKQPPRKIAERLQHILGTANGLLEKTEVAGPGFLNMFVTKNAWLDALHRILQQGPEYLKSNAGQGKKVLVEFVSANPTGPLHVAHGRGAVIGDVVAKLFEMAGYSVKREYYVNDLGNQVDVLARSIHLRYLELLGKPFTPPEDFYPGEYIIDIAKVIYADHQNQFFHAAESIWLPIFKKRGIELMLARIREDLGSFGVHFDQWASEQEVTQRIGIPSLVKKLEQQGHVFEQDKKKWFRATSFGDDKDRVMLREDGTPTYFAGDVAYHYDKLARGFEHLINVWGADHGGYVTRVKAGLAGLGYDPKILEVILVQMVSLSQKGDKVRMGKRLGTAVWLKEVVQEVGHDAFRFFFLMRKADAQLDFDVDLATKKSLDNPVYYAQMGHARMCSIERKAIEAKIELPSINRQVLDALVLTEEIDLIKAMDQAPNMIVDAALAREPHQVIHYIQNTIATFHSYYTKYKNTEKVVSTDVKKTEARLLLCRALKICLKSLLTEVLGVDAPNRMVLLETEAGEQEL